MINRIVFTIDFCYNEALKVRLAKAICQKLMQLD